MNIVLRRERFVALSTNHQLLHHLHLFMFYPLSFVFLESSRVPATTAPAPTPSYCHTSNGRRYEEGDSWHDGCRDCFCHSGREMCVLISCPIPSCPHPVVKPDQCCPTCDGMFLHFNQVLQNHKISG